MQPRKPWVHSKQPGGPRRLRDIIAWCLCEVARARTTRKRRPQPLKHARRARLARSTMLPDALAARRGRDEHTLNRQKGGMNGAR